MLFKKLTAGLLFVITLFGLFQRNRADRAEAEAEKQSTRANASESSKKTYQRINKWRESVQQTHREEQVDAKQRLDAGDRSHLDDNG